MSKRYLGFLAAALVGVCVSPVMATAAHAAKSTPSVTVNASPEPVRAGSSVKVAGRVGSGTSGNNGRVNIYFRKASASTFTYVGYTSASASGTYAKYLKQSTSGVWKVRFLGNTRRNANWSGTDYVEAQAYRNVTTTRFSKSGTGDYTSAPITMYVDKPALVTMTAQCVEPDYNFLSVDWIGHPEFDWEMADLSFPTSGYAASGSSYMYPSVRDGFIDITTQDDCSWTVKITQVVRKLVKV
ncbi:hypothetical protein GCM10009682_49210 [Luedemannella flava]|uniref:Uncharacterized protein n=1 Tax=Luedemannella flava TaxID=349316 RepID=A0ABN2MFE2_9ACTN